MYNYSIIKNWRAELTYDGDRLRIRADYVSLTSSSEFGPFDLLLTEVETQGEWLICIDKVLGTLSLESPFVAVPASLEPLAWVTQGFVLEEYFIKADEVWDQQSVHLYLPKTYLGKLTEENVKPNENFRAFGKNFPGSAVTVGELIPNFPGIEAGGTAIAKQKEYPAIATWLTSSFTESEVKLGAITATSWETKFGQDSNTEFSSNMQGLAREDYSFIEYVPLLRRDVVNRAIYNKQASNTIFLTEINGQKVISAGNIENFRYSLVVGAPSDLAINVVEKGVPSVQVYNGQSIEGTILTTTQGITLQLKQERYIPEVKLEQLISVSEFVQGFSYKIQPTQPLPASWISTGALTGRVPATGIRSWNYKPIQNSNPENDGPVNLWQAKATRHSAEFLYRLYKLRKGKEYDCNTSQLTETIRTGPQNFTQLELETLETLVVGYNAVAEAILGYDTNQVFVRLPFDYKRDSLEWNLAHEITEAFVTNYTIGYNEFVADFSVCGEPIFAIDGCYDNYEVTNNTNCASSTSYYIGSTPPPPIFTLSGGSTSYTVA